MASYRDFQRERYDRALAQTVARLRDLADRVEREGTPSEPHNKPHAAAGRVVHEIHSALANLPLDTLIEVASEATFGDDTDTTTAGDTTPAEPDPAAPAAGEPTDPDTIPVPDWFWGQQQNKARMESNEARAAAKGLEPCSVCGRGVAEGRGWWAEVVDGGASIARADFEADNKDPGYMGMWRLGPECAKRLPVAYRTKDQGEAK